MTLPSTEEPNPDIDAYVIERTVLGEPKRFIILCTSASHQTLDISEACQIIDFLSVAVDRANDPTPLNEAVPPPLWVDGKPPEPLAKQAAPPLPTTLEDFI